MGILKFLWGGPGGLPALMWPKPDVPDGREGQGARGESGNLLHHTSCGIQLIVTYFRKRQGAH